MGARLRPRRRTELLLGLIAGAAGSALVAWARRPRRGRRGRTILRGLVATLGSAGTAAILYEAGLLLLRTLNSADEDTELDQSADSQGAPSDSAAL